MEFLGSIGLIGLGLLLIGAIIFGTIFIAISFRKVVPTNMVHIVQSQKATTSYGVGREKGNVYYKWPYWVPFGFGVEVIELPVSNFDLSLDSYEAYDRDRVPFLVDVTAFFRIIDTNLAAQRASSVQELQSQLIEIVRGTVRTVLASDVIDTIMLERTKFGDLFTQEVQEQLKNWGVESVKSIELMDIRDSRDSQVIANIMAKKKSEIEMDSRMVVAENMRAAEEKEIEARRDVALQDQQAQQAVGERTAEKDKMVGIAQEQSNQQVLEEARETAEKTMNVKQVEIVRLAEIQKEQEVIKAEEDRQRLAIVAQGRLEETQKDAEGIKLDGEARATAEKLMQMAPVEAQIALAKEIGNNPNYMKYLTALEAIAAQVKVGMENAQALTKGDLKIIANSGSPVEGISKISDMFGPGGATTLAAGLEALAQGDIGSKIFEKFGIKTDDEEVSDVATNTEEETRVVPRSSDEVPF